MPLIVIGFEHHVVKHIFNKYFGRILFVYSILFNFYEKINVSDKSGSDTEFM